MRKTRLSAMQFLTIGLALAGIPGLQAADPAQVKWDEVCRYAQNREIDFHTTAGDDIKGVCLSVSVNEMSVRTLDGRVVKVMRTTFHKLRLHKVKSNQLKELGRDMNYALGSGVAMIFSPLAPVGIVTVPATLAWGAVAAPFCLIGDLHDKLHGTREVEVI